MIDAATLARLVAPGGHTLSLYMPITGGDRDIRAPEARLRGLVEEAEALLAPGNGAADGAAGERQSLLRSLHRFAAGVDFAHHRAPGLAVFVRAGGDLQASEPLVVELPHAPPALVVAGPDFHIKPLLPLLAANRRFNILALSKGNVKLLSATPFACAQIPLDHLTVEAQAELDSRTESDPSVTPDALAEERKALLLAETRRTVAAVKAALGDDDAPLVLVGDPNVAGHFAGHAHLRQLHPVQLHLNPFALSDTELRDKALEALAPEFAGELDAVLDQVNARLGTAAPTVAIRLEEILQAAQDGRVDAVVVAEDEALWGRFDAGKVMVHGRPGPDEEDLLNQAALLALRHGGRAFAIPRERMPRHVPAAANLRF